MADVPASVEERRAERRSRRAREEDILMGGSGMHLSIMLAAAALAAGCGDSSHSPLPELTNLGGPQLAHPKLVPIFFAGDDQAPQLTQFSQWIVTSNWLDQVGSEYGVGPGTMPGAVQ